MRVVFLFIFCPTLTLPRFRSCGPLIARADVDVAEEIKKLGSMDNSTAAAAALQAISQFRAARK